VLTTSQLYPGEMMSVKVVKLTRGYISVIDPEDFSLISDRLWYAHVNSDGSVYAANKRPSDRCFLHNRILNSKPVDHINGRTLDNRRVNLRLCGKVRNGQNRGRQANGSSNYKGVSWAAGRWRAVIKADGKNINLGRFDDEESAAIAYDEAARRCFGEYGRYNFPRDNERSALI
jgi:AP2 domain